MEDQLLKILGEEMLEPEEPLQKNSNLFEAGLDSMGIMQLLIAIEDSFEVSIDPVDLSRDNFKTVNSIAELIRSKQS